MPPSKKNRGGKKSKKDPLVPSKKPIVTGKTTVVSGENSFITDTVKFSQLSLAERTDPQDVFLDQVDFIAFDEPQVKKYSRINFNSDSMSLSKPMKSSANRARPSISALSPPIGSKLTLPKKTRRSKRTHQKSAQEFPAESTQSNVVSPKENLSLEANGQSLIAQLRKYLHSCGVSLEVYNCFIEKINSTSSKYATDKFLFIHEETMNFESDRITSPSDFFVERDDCFPGESLSESDSLSSTLSVSLSGTDSLDVLYGNILEPETTDNLLSSEIDSDDELFGLPENTMLAQEDFQDQMYQLNQRECNIIVSELSGPGKMDSELSDCKASSDTLLENLHLETLQLFKKQKKNIKKVSTSGFDRESSRTQPFSFAEVNRTLKRFLQEGVPDELALQPMTSDERKVIHSLAHEYRLKSKSKGKGNNRFIVIYRTKHSTFVQYRNWDKIKHIIARAEREAATRLSSYELMKFGPGKKHQKERYSVLPSSIATKIPIAEENVGNQLLRKLGWAPGQGLGNDGQGRVEPITTTLRKKNAGLGT